MTRQLNEHEKELHRQQAMRRRIRERTARWEDFIKHMELLRQKRPEMTDHDLAVWLATRYTYTTAGEAKRRGAYKRKGE